MHRMALVLTLLFTTATVAQTDSDDDVFPQQMTASDLKRTCASSTITRTGRERLRYCRGFVSGVEEAVRQFESTGGARPSVCITPGTSARALAEAYLRYAAGKDFDPMLPAAASVIKGLRRAFPCDAQPKKG